MIYDNRGAGYSESTPGLYTSHQMATDALQLLNYLNWTENIHIVGISMGGMIALELALMDTKRFESLTLTSTHGGRTVPPVKIHVFYNLIIHTT